MLTVITCRQCGGNPCPNEIGEVSATIVLEALRGRCEKCSHRDTREQKIWFCSPECMLAFIAEGELDREVGIANGTINPWADADIDPVNGR